MDNKKINFVLIVLGALAILMLIGAIIKLNHNERRVGRDCESIIHERTNGSGYLPLPKECEKGE